MGPRAPRRSRQRGWGRVQPSRSLQRRSYPRGEAVRHENCSRHGRLFALTVTSPSGPTFGGRRLGPRSGWTPIAPSPTESPLAYFRSFIHYTERCKVVVTETQGVQAMPEGRSRGKKPKVEDRRYLRPDEAHRLIDAAGKRGRYPFRDRVLVRLVYRHGLRASEAVNMRWSQLDLDAGSVACHPGQGKQRQHSQSGPR